MIESIPSLIHHQYNQCYSVIDVHRSMVSTLKYIANQRDSGVDLLVIISS
jgi:hypothetical protein